MELISIERLSFWRAMFDVTGGKNDNTVLNMSVIADKLLNSDSYSPREYNN